MKPGPGSLKTINKIDKPLAKLIKEKRERTQISKMTTERREITTKTSGMPVRMRWKPFQRPTL